MYRGVFLSDEAASAAQYWAPKHGNRRNKSTANVSQATIKQVYNKLRYDTVLVTDKCPPGAFVSVDHHYSETEVPSKFGVGISAWRYAVAGLVRAGLVEERYIKNRRYLRALPDLNDRRIGSEIPW